MYEKGLIAVFVVIVERTPTCEELTVLCSERDFSSRLPLPLQTM